jgi:hypothetical protein
MENTDFSQGSEVSGDKPKFVIVADKSGKSIYFSPTTEHTIKIRFSGHHLKWIWSVEGTTTRKPDKVVKMRNWSKYIYSWKGTKVVLNPQTFELWMRSRPYKSVEKMIYANWSKADLLAREFSQFAQISLHPIKTEHPADIAKAHLVLTTKQLNPILKPMSEVKDDVGLLFDKSHKDYPELSGKKSVEGAKGAEWFFTQFPQQHAVILEALSGFKEYNRNIKLHLKVLQEIREALKEMKR